MGVHSKLAHLVERYSPDIAIIPECAEEHILRNKAGLLMPECTMAWIGLNPNKGLGVFGFGPYSVELATCYDDRLDLVAPIEVRGPHPFALLAIWAMNHRAKRHHPDYASIPQPAAAAELYRDWAAGRDLMVAGDFNHNVLWDKTRMTERNHANTVSAWEAHGLRSAYHAFTGEAQGQETVPTIYWRNRTEEGPRYHIDFAFLPEHWIKGLVRLELGTFEEWVATKLSDHVPMLLEINDDALDRPQSS